MRAVVSKFGGSSIANAGQFKRILGIIRASPARRCAVLSAPGTDENHCKKVTELLEACWQHRDEPSQLDRAAEKVAKRFREIADGLSLPSQDDLVLREVVEAVHISLPHTLSRGEYLCARLFSLYSGIPMVDAAEVVAFDGDMLDCERTRTNFDELERRFDRVILPGFYGSDLAGQKIHVFPRNGSDITGAVAAADMDAGLYENWTDVPGLMTADPSVVPEARLIPLVGYRQMRAMSRAGARVLHPDSLDPVAMAGIPTRLRDTTRPDAFGTLIDERFDRTVPALALNKRAILPYSSNEYAACVTVFGLSAKRVRAAAREFEPMYVCKEAQSVRVYVEASRGEDCLRGMHRALIE